jgi:hypothetical protein
MGSGRQRIVREVFRTRKTARVGFPMGGSSTMMTVKSWWGARAAQPLRFRLGGRVAEGMRQTRGSVRGEMPASRSSLPHVRHDFPSACLCEYSMTAHPAVVNCIYAQKQWASIVDTHRVRRHRSAAVSASR